MKFSFEYKKIKKRLLVAEIVLLIASVFIFRGLWMLIDLVPAMHTPLALFLSLGIGIILTIVALRYIIRHGK